MKVKQEVLSVEGLGAHWVYEDVEIGDCLICGGPGKVIIQDWRVFCVEHEWVGLASLARAQDAYNALLYNFEGLSAPTTEADE